MPSGVGATGISAPLCPPYYHRCQGKPPQLYRRLGRRTALWRGGSRVCLERTTRLVEGQQLEAVIGLAAGTTTAMGTLTSSPQE